MIRSLSLTTAILFLTALVLSACEASRRLAQVTTSDPITDIGKTPSNAPVTKMETATFALG